MLAAVVIAVAFLFGGGTRPGLLSDTLIAWVGGIALVATLPNLFIDPELRSGRAYAVALVCLMLVPVGQLVPLPPWLWTMLPGHADQVAAFQAAGLQPDWQPLSIAPSLTAGAVIALAAPVAAFLLVLQLTPHQRQILMLALLGFGVLSVALGFLQVSQGDTSPLRFYAVTNPSEAVGFFANRNHFGALLYMLVPVAAAVAIAAGVELGEPGQDRSARDLVLVAVAGGVFALLLLAQGVVRSRAGLAITGVSIVASFFLLATWQDRSSSWRSVRYLVAAAAIGLVLVANFALFRLLQRADYDPVDPYRTAMNATTWQAAKSFLPFGSGLGTFVPVYFSFERLGDLTGEYVNRAHDDYLESLLESGFVAPLVLLAFLAWWLRRSWAIWRQPITRSRTMDGLLARAATISLALPLIHSAFDYPLRTEALMTLYAVFAAMLVPPLAQDAVEPGKPRPQTAERRRRSTRGDTVPMAPIVPTPVKAGVRGLPPKLPRDDGSVPPDNPPLER